MDYAEFMAFQAMLQNGQAQQLPPMQDYSQGLHNIQPNNVPPQPNTVQTPNNVPPQPNTVQFNPNVNMPQQNTLPNLEQMYQMAQLQQAQQMAQFAQAQQLQQGLQMGQFAQAQQAQSVPPVEPPKDDPKPNDTQLSDEAKAQIEALKNQITDHTKENNDPEPKDKYPELDWMDSVLN